MGEFQAQADVCVVCALAEEARAFLGVVQQVHQIPWSSHTDAHGYQYQYTTILNENKESLTLHVSWLARPDATTMTHHLSRVLEIAQPRFVVMPGICAGDQQQVHLGDVVVAERTFTYDTGKFTTDEHGRQVHLHDTLTTEPPATLLQFLRLFDTWKTRVASLDRPISLRQQRDWLLHQLLSIPSVRDIPQATLDQCAPEWRQVVHVLQQGSDALLSETLALRDPQIVERLRYGRDPFPFQDPSEAQCRIAALAAGNAVRQDDPFQEIQIPVHGAIAIDLQGAAFGRVMQGVPTIPWLIVKGVAHYATKDKDEAYRNYAARASAHYTLKVIENYVTQQRPPRSQKDTTDHAPLWNIPYPRNPFFTGQEELLKALHDRFQQGHTAALSQPQAASGLGGIGKTQIALEYAHRYQQEYQYILWCFADTQESLVFGYGEIARLLELPQKDEQDQNVLVQAVRQWLMMHHRWLLILDNADDLGLVRPFLPTRYNGHILLTTRAQAIGGIAHQVEVQTMNLETSSLLLLRRAGFVPHDAPMEAALPADRELAHQIARELGDLPLALDQAGAYIEETQCSLVDYLNQYQTQRVRLLKRRGGVVPDHPEPVATTWTLSFKQVQQRSLLSEVLLSLCTYLAPDAIPEFMLLEGMTAIYAFLDHQESIGLDEAIAILGAFSLIHRDRDHKHISVHRLVQAVLRDCVDTETEMALKQYTLRMLCATCPDTNDVTVWEQCDQWIPHVLECAVWIDGTLMKQELIASIFNNAGYYLSKRARYPEAQPLYERALAIHEELLGLYHPNTTSILNNLAMLYYNQGKYQEAEPLYERALTIREEYQGSSHPNTALILNNLAVLYHNQGRYQKAKCLYERVLMIREKHLGPSHPDVAVSLNNLAGLYYEQGQYQEAKPLYERALMICEEYLGPSHPDTALILNNLTKFYCDQGQYQEAEPLYERVLMIREKHLGPFHPKTAYNLNNLAMLYHNQGRYQKAYPLLQRALAIYEERLGPSHPDTALILNNLAGLHNEQGQYQEAEALYKQAIAIYKELLGSSHSHTVTSLYNLAMLYAAQGEYQKAQPLLQQALHIYQEQLGSDHPRTYMAQCNHTNLLQRLKEHEIGTI